MSDRCASLDLPQLCHLSDRVPFRQNLVFRQIWFILTYCRSIVISYLIWFATSYCIAFALRYTKSHEKETSIFPEIFRRATYGSNISEAGTSSQRCVTGEVRGQSTWERWQTECNQMINNCAPQPKTSRTLAIPWTTNFASLRVVTKLKNMATTKQAYRPLDGEEKNLADFEDLQGGHSQKSTWPDISTIVLSMTIIIFGHHCALASLIENSSSKSSIEFSRVKFKRAFRYNESSNTYYREHDPAEPQYIGPWSPEIDKAWEDLLDGK